MSHHTPHDLYNLARNNPVVHALLTVWERGDCTLERALIGMVLQLAEQTAEMQRQVLHLLQNQPGPAIVTGPLPNVSEEENARLLAALKEWKPMPLQDVLTRQRTSRFFVVDEASGHIVREG